MGNSFQRGGEARKNCKFSKICSHESDFDDPDGLDEVAYAQKIDQLKAQTMHQMVEQVELVELEAKRGHDEGRD